MKVFLATSVANPDLRSPLLRDLAAYITSKHPTFHYERDLTKGRDGYSFNKLVAEIDNADVFIAEMTHASQTLGFQLAHALRISKQCLYLYDSMIKNKPDGLIGNIPSRNLKIKSYNASNYQKVIDNFIDYAKKQQETYRTSFMSTREIDEYISSYAAKLGISKGEAIRELLHQSIENSR